MSHKHRKPSGGVRHFIRAKKREKFYSSLGIKRKDLILVDNSLTKRSSYFDNKNGVYCKIDKKIIKIDDCLERKEKGLCKEKDCINQKQI